jgi:UDPglucose--hexose-1-phosphate uridylyltransferase
MAVNEFRKDLVSGDWVLISSLRAKRPHDGVRERLVQTSRQCVFEPGNLHEQSDPLLVYNNGAEVAWAGDWNGPWTTAVIKNKFPALQAGVCGAPHQVGPYHVHEAFGFHELVITRDHEKHFAQFTDEETAEVLRAYRDRFIAIAKDDCGDYISIFHNHGRAAGASVMHNHSQIISTPIVPPEIVRSLQGADDFFQQYGKPVHQTMIEWEQREDKRIVYQNDAFIAFCPFVSKAGYEVRIFPKRQLPRFDASTDAELVQCANVLNVVLRKLCIALDDVDYNFYIHTAPIQHDPLIEYDYYHWHIEVVPRIPIAAGFELSTAIYINPFDPDDAAQHLRETDADL